MTFKIQTAIKAGLEYCTSQLFWKEIKVIVNIKNLIGSIVYFLVLIHSKLYWYDLDIFMIHDAIGRQDP